MGASLSEQCIADLMSWHTSMDNNRICHRLLFHERSKQYFVQPFVSVNEAAKTTHTL